MTLVDTHAHVDASGGLASLAAPDGDEFGVQVIAVTNLPRHYARLHTVFNERVQWALGLHPGEPHPTTSIEDFLTLLPDCPAIGEVGLDGAPATSPRSVPFERQREELARILSHPVTTHRLVSLHSRRSVTAVIEHLREAAIPGAVLHWFTGTPAQARKAADTGAYFSVNHRMSRKQDLLGVLPRDRVLLETDAPHTGKRTRPGDVWPAVLMLAEVWSTSASAAADQIHANQDELRGAL